MLGRETGSEGGATDQVLGREAGSGWEAGESGQLRFDCAWAGAREPLKHSEPGILRCWKGSGLDRGDHIGFDSAGSALVGNPALEVEVYWTGMRLDG